jgi:hypothetical protein
MTTGAGSSGLGTGGFLYAASSVHGFAAVIIAVTYGYREFADQRRRNMFVQQYANQRRAPGSLSIRKCFFGRPGGCPSRAASRA